MNRTRATILAGATILALGVLLHAWRIPRPHANDARTASDTAARDTATRPPSAPAERVAGRGEPIPADIRRRVRDIKRGLSTSRETLHRTLDELADAARSDPRALQGLLRDWERRTGTELGDTLGVALGFVDDPGIAARALDVARGARRREQRLSGLQLLDRVDSTDPVIIAGLVDLLNGERDPGVVAGAIYGLGRIAEDENVRRSVIDALQGTVSNADPEVRRRSVVAIAEWASTVEDVAPVLAKLDDPSPVVRTGAAFALGRTTHLAPEAAARVAALAVDQTQDWTIRTIARNTTARIGGYEDAVRSFDDDLETMQAARPPVAHGDDGD